MKTFPRFGSVENKVTKNYMLFISSARKKTSSVFIFVLLETGQVCSELFQCVIFSVMCMQNRITPQRYVLSFWFSLNAIFFIYHVTCEERKHKIIWAAPQQCFLRRTLLENLVKSGVWKFDEESNLGMFYISVGDR